MGLVVALGKPDNADRTYVSDLADTYSTERWL